MMKAIAWALLGLAAGNVAVVVDFEITGVTKTVPTLVVFGCACLVVSVTLFFVDGYRRKQRDRLRAA